MINESHVKRAWSVVRAPEVLAPTRGAATTQLQLLSFSNVDTETLDFSICQRSWNSVFLFEISQIFPCGQLIQYEQKQM